MAKNKFIALFALLSTLTVHAAAPPTVVFVGDEFMYNWQQSAAFQANPNWVGQGIQVSSSLFGETEGVAAAFQSALNLHPGTVFIETGTSDISWQIDSTPLGPQWQIAATGIIQMVQMAKRANVKVILGTVVSTGYNSSYFNGWVQNYGQSQNIPVVDFQYLISGCTTPINESGSYTSFCTYLTPTFYPSIPVPNAAGFASMTGRALNAIQTQGLTIKRGYLSDVWNDMTPDGGSPVTQVNSVPTGAGLQFTAQATWSDGVTRPLAPPFSSDFNTATLGTWWSSNPKVMTINQQGHAAAYLAGTATIWFRSASGVTFAPWVIGVGSNANVPEPVY